MRIANCEGKSERKFAAGPKKAILNENVNDLRVADDDISDGGFYLRRSTQVNGS